MTDPIKKSFSKEEALEYAKRWMEKNYGNFRAQGSERYHERLGLLVHLLSDMFEEKP